MEQNANDIPADTQSPIFVRDENFRDVNFRETIS
jgi:hypothetical protein